MRQRPAAEVVSPNFDRERTALKDLSTDVAIRWSGIGGEPGSLGVKIKINVLFSYL
jgi:hypothetical protein